MGLGGGGGVGNGKEVALGGPPSTLMSRGQGGGGRLGVPLPDLTGLFLYATLTRWALVLAAYARLLIGMTAPQG